MNRSNAALAVVVMCSATVMAETAWAERQAPRCSEEMSALLLKHARKHGVPIDLLHRVVIRESRYNAAARHSRYYGLMQITYATAKSMGYHGAPNGLLDAETNLTYAVPYLANAYMLSHGNDDRAVRLYAAGYYATAKQQHMIADLRTAESPAVVPVALAMAPPEPANPVAKIFSLLTSPPAASTPTDAEAHPAAPTAPAAPATASSEPEKAAPAMKAVAAAQSGKPAAHVAEAKPSPAKASAAAKLQVASAAANPPKGDDRLRGAVEPVSAGFTTASVPETPAPADAAATEKPQVATMAAKARHKPTKLAKKPHAPAEPAQEVADAGAPDAAADDQPNVETAPPAKAAGRTKRSTHAAKKQVAAKEAPAAESDAAAETTQVARQVKAKPRHAHVLQAAASKAEVTPDP